VRVRIESSRGSVETSALVNTGFETPNPQILLPVKAAEKLGLWSDLPKLAEGVEAVADAVISPIEVEVLISDKLADELMIAIEKPGEGLWRLRGESAIRRSEKPEIWL